MTILLTPSLSVDLRYVESPYYTTGGYLDGRGKRVLVLLLRCISQRVPPFR